jgi:hypothetical protein
MYVIFKLKYIIFPHKYFGQYNTVSISITIEFLTGFVFITAIIMKNHHFETETRKILKLIRDNKNQPQTQSKILSFN